MRIRRKDLEALGVKRGLC